MRSRRITLHDSKLDTREQTKIFGRLADKNLLLDVPGAGSPEMMNCCHGGCDNCEYSRIFDNLSSGRPKWIPIYIERQLVDGRSHISPWKGIFENDNEISKEDFISRLRLLEYRACLGPPSTVPSDELPTDETLNTIWLSLISDETHTKLSSTQLVNRLKDLSGVEHGITWPEWIKAFS
eukprot:gene12609-26549_t